MNPPRVLIADLHLTDRTVFGRPRLVVGLNVLEQSYRVAKEYKAPCVEILGDLLDSKTRISLDVLLALRNFFDTHRDIHWLWLRGNHESPDRQAPEKSIMALFEGVGAHGLADIVTAPRVQRGNPHLVWMPWYPAEMYLQKLAEAVEGIAGPAQLMTHLGLRDGHASGSNFHPPSKLGVEDLFKVYPWQIVLLGDYHEAQQVGDRPCYYIGAALPQDFGESGAAQCMVYTQGSWGRRELEAPRFCKWAITSQETLGLKGYRASDYNRIQVMPEFLEQVRLLYPDAEPLLIQEAEFTTEEPGEGPRLVDGDQLPTLMQQYLEYRNLGSRSTEYMAVGMKIVEKSKMEVA